MSGKPTATSWTGLRAISIALALAVLPLLLYAGIELQTSGQDKLVVHEWGTFTSFAGSDGVSLEFRPLVTSDLPPFVMNPFSQPGSPLSSFLKSRYVALQRMETPVTYFYTDVPRVVNVRVAFPDGMLTDWYPVVKHFKAGQADHHPSAAFLDWGAVRLTPAGQFDRVRVRDSKGQPIAATLPAVSADHHYGRARETDSAIVETVDPARGSHFEKFLFYRGLGNFELPIRLTALGHDRFEITNKASEPSGSLLLVRIDDGRVRFQRLRPVGSGSSVEILLPTTEATTDQLAEAMATELIGAGLYQKEAWAMVNTWRSSWFGENGTRLLYLLPETLTDKLLPLTVEPAPDERVRVLVGRLETLTPEDCRRLVQRLGGEAKAPPSSEVINQELAALGRFAEPAIRFVIGQTRDVPIRSRLEAILADLRRSKVN